MWRKILLGLSFAVALGPMVTARAASSPPPGFVEWLLATEPDGSPTAMDFAPDGRLFVLDQGGNVWVIKNGALLPTPFVHISVNNNGERGLLGIAFDPAFNSNHFVYLYYTAPSTPSTPVHNRVSRFTANGDVAVAGSEVAILNLPGLDATNHNGGPLHFGQDGTLYIGVGENANTANSQNIDTMLGKILRINPDGSFPTDNPFYTTPTAPRSAVWALGVRNPYTFAVDPSGGTIYINDVGGGSYEEINMGAARANYGWPTTEGYFNPASYNPANFTGTLTSPLYAYSHSSGCAITGGAFYRPAVDQFPASYVGQYFFADYCGDWIGVYDPVTHTAIQDFVTGTGGGTVDLKVGPDGSLYYLDHYTGEIFVIQYAQNQPPFFSHQPQDLTVTEGDPASFTCETSDDTATYKWQRDSGGGFADIIGATSTTYTLDPTTLSDSGAVFHCIAENTYGSRASNDATLTVVSNLPPTATIIAPSPSLLFRGGSRISFSGKAADPEDGTLPASAFTWKVDLYHYDATPADVHVHPAMAPKTGSRKGSFTIPNVGETSPNVWYRFTLTVTDSNHNTSTTFRDVYPRLTAMTFDANPPLMDFTVDGQPQTTHLSITGVAGMLRSISAPPHRGDGGTVWQFSKWKPGGKMARPLKTPLKNTTYIAQYVERQILNGSFETLVNHGSRPAKWRFTRLTGFDGSDCTTAPAAGLLCSLHLVGGASAKTAIQSIRLAGQTGDSYTLSFSTHGVGASANGFNVRLVMQNKDHTTTVQSFDLPAGDSDWTDQTLTVLATTIYTQVQVIITANPGATGDAWFDHFVLTTP